MKMLLFSVIFSEIILMMLKVHDVSMDMIASSIPQCIKGESQHIWRCEIMLMFVLSTTVNIFPHGGNVNCICQN